MLMHHMRKSLREALRVEGRMTLPHERVIAEEIEGTRRLPMGRDSKTSQS
jgi:hypothetical protein